VTLDSVRNHAKAAGFELCGVARLGSGGSTDFNELGYFPEWIAEGRAGEMEYLKARNDQGELKRAALRNAAPWAKSVVVCAINYNSDKPYSTEMQDKSRGWISRYAWSGAGGKATDYHASVLQRLRRVEAAIQEEAGVGGAEIQTRCYVDTGPLIERVYAKYAGIGWIAKNTCIINQGLGSWLFMGSILTSVQFQEEASASLDIPADRCGSCTRCIEACPTGALTEPYKMDARLCISYLTIEKRGMLPDGLRSKMGNNVFGCDICQDVCPWNGHAQPNAPLGGKPPRAVPVSAAPEFQPREELFAPALERLGTMSREQFNEQFRGSPIKRAKYQGIRRNAIVSMGNSGNRDFVPVLEKLTNDEDAIVAEHARWSLQKLAEVKTT
jgi:epoxyqueuosine reductase